MTSNHQRCNMEERLTTQRQKKTTSCIILFDCMDLHTEMHSSSHSITYFESETFYSWVGRFFPCCCCSAENWSEMACAKGIIIRGEMITQTKVGRDLFPLLLVMQ